MKVTVDIDEDLIIKQIEEIKDKMKENYLLTDRDANALDLVVKHLKELKEGSK